MKKEFLSILKHFCMWFVVFGISHFWQNRGWGEQGKVFLFLDLGINLIIIAIVAIGCLLREEKVLGLKKIIVIDCLVVIMTLLVTYVAVQIFKIDFFVVYQIMTFGQCLFPTNKK